MNLLDKVLLQDEEHDHRNDEQQLPHHDTELYELHEVFDFPDQVTLGCANQLPSKLEFSLTIRCCFAAGNTLRGVSVRAGFPLRILVLIYPVGFQKRVMASCTVILLTSISGFLKGCSDTSSLKPFSAASL